MNNNCITNLLKYISLLQTNSISNCDNVNSCSKPFLGDISSSCYNTRVISLYKRDGSLFTTVYNNTTSSVFRIMSITGNCCTLLILTPTNYQSTNQFITLDLNCICAVRCIEDVYVNNI